MRVLACITLWMLLGTFACVSCVDALLPAAQVAPGREIAAAEVPAAEGVSGLVDNISGGSFSRIGGSYHDPYQGWSEINMAAAKAKAAVRAAEAAKPDPPVTVVNVRVVERAPRRHYHGHRPGTRRRVLPPDRAPGSGSNAGRF